MTTYFLRALLFLIITVLWYVGLWWVSLPLCLWYTYRYTAYELIVLGVCIDIQFQVYTSWPYYSIFGTTLVIIVEWLRPHLAVYTTEV